jgi:hypothetical protein
MRIMSVLAATAAGAAVGWVCGLVRVWPPVRLAAAAILGSFTALVAVVAFVLLSLRRPESAGIGAVSFGLSDAVVLGVPASALIGVAGYFTLRRLGWSDASLTTYGPFILGGAAALITALWVASGVTNSGAGN